MKFMNLARAAAGAALGLTLAFGSAAPALAATITISNPVANESYTAYKILDVTAQGENYSYYTENEQVKNWLDENGLDFTKASGVNRWYVSNSADIASVTELAQNLNALMNDTTANPSFSDLFGEGTAAQYDDESKKLVVDYLGAGYYFVDSSLGSLCALNTLTTEVEVNEKNSVPSVTKKVKEDSTDTFGEKATVDVTDTVYYQLTVNTGTNSNGIGTGVDGNYVIVDQLPDGITYNEGSVAIEGWSSDTDYTVSYNSDANALTITLLSTGKLGTLGQNQDVVITYNADPSDTLAVDTAHTNTVTLTYKNRKMTDEAVVKTYDIAKGGVVKVDQDGEALAGVKFVLSKNEKGVTKYAVIENNYLKQWVGTQSDATELTTDESGHIYVNGLDADTYILTETATLDGYNLLNDTITVVIAEDGSVSYKLTNSESEAGPSIEVENHTGQELPTTGGMGTTALYIVGGVLVAGAGITLVVRRRMSAEA